MLDCYLIILAPPCLYPVKFLQVSITQNRSGALPQAQIFQYSRRLPEQCNEAKSMLTIVLNHFTMHNCWDYFAMTLEL